MKTRQQVTTGTPQVVTRAQARRLLMGAQGLLDDPGRAASPAELQKLLERMGFVQLDSINVVERAHHLTLFSRLDGYRREHLRHLLEVERGLFEHWTHDASAIPVKWFAHWKPRFARERVRIRQSRWWGERMGAEPEQTLARVRRRLTREGPLRSQDFETEKGSARASSTWWGWKPEKAALEYLWMTGEISVVRRENFQKVYDLTTRVLPAHAATPRPATGEHVEWACATALERLGVATPRELAQYWAAVGLEDAKRWCVQAQREGRIVPVLVEQSDAANPLASYACAGWAGKIKSLPDAPTRARLLSPFDPVLRDRARSHRLFDFDYRFEAFVPALRRQHGYYVLPVLEGERFVARIDPKFRRDAGVLEVKRVFWEPDVRVTRARREALGSEVRRLATFIGAEKVSWPTSATSEHENH